MGCKDMIKHKIKLGQKVKDKISGFEGIAIVRVTALNGCIQYAVKPMYLDKDGKIPQSESIDQQQLKIIDEKSITTRVRPKKLKFKLGDKVEHIITGFHGTTTVVVEHISGAIEYGVKPMMKPDEKKIPDAVAISQEVLALRKEKPVKVEKKKTGGVIQDLKYMNLG